VALQEGREIFFFTFFPDDGWCEGKSQSGSCCWSHTRQRGAIPRHQAPCQPIPRGSCPCPARLLALCSARSFLHLAALRPAVFLLPRVPLQLTRAFCACCGVQEERAKLQQIYSQRCIAKSKGGTTTMVAVKDIAIASGRLAVRCAQSTNENVLHVEAGSNL
jgi:hypothetical protein